MNAPNSGAAPERIYVPLIFLDAPPTALSESARWLRITPHHEIRKEGFQEYIRSDLAVTSPERIETPCPSCGAKSLFIGTGGHLTCSVLGCKDPVVECAVDACKILLARLENHQKTGSFDFPVAPPSPSREEVKRGNGFSIDEVRRLRALVKAQQEYIAFLGSVMDKDVSYLHCHGMGHSTEDITKGTQLRARISELTPKPGEKP